MALASALAFVSPPAHARRSGAPRTQPVTVSGATPPPTTGAAVTQPLQSMPAEAAPQQGFQPVSEGEIRTESRDGGN